MNRPREDEPGAQASRAVPAMPPDAEDDPRHEAVLATGPVLPTYEGEPAPRRDLLWALGRAKPEVATLGVLVFVPAVFGFLGLLAGLLLVAACRRWDSRAKLVAFLVVPLAAMLFAVVVAWLRATQVSEAENSRTRVSIAWHALADAFAALPVTVGVLAAAYLAVVLVRSSAAER